MENCGGTGWCEMGPGEKGGRGKKSKKKRKEKALRGNISFST